MSATILAFAPPPAASAITARAIEPSYDDYVTVNDIMVGTSYWPQPPGHEDRAWTAWYEADEPDDLGGMNFGHGATRERAIANLFFLYPRED